MELILHILIALAVIGTCLFVVLATAFYLGKAVAIGWYRGRDIYFTRSIKWQRQDDDEKPAKSDKK